MKTQEFIERHLHTTDGKERWCSSVKTDGRGNFYSYGEHYPLIVKINGRFYVNDAGYSSSTAKHIHWALNATRFANQYDYLYNYNYSKFKTSLEPKDILAAIKAERWEVLKKIPQVPKRAFRQKANLENRLKQLSLTN